MNKMIMNDIDELFWKSLSEKEKSSIRKFICAYNAPSILRIVYKENRERGLDIRRISYRDRMLKESGISPQGKKHKKVSVISNGTTKISVKSKNKPLTYKYVKRNVDIRSISNSIEEGITKASASLISTVIDLLIFQLNLSWGSMAMQLCKLLAELIIGFLKANKRK